MNMENTSLMNLSSDNGSASDSVPILPISELAVCSSCRTSWASFPSLLTRSRYESTFHIAWSFTLIFCLAYVSIGD